VGLRSVSGTLDVYRTEVAGERFAGAKRAGGEEIGKGQQRKRE
jgi:hypothetical protein